MPSGDVDRRGGLDGAGERSRRAVERTQRCDRALGEHDEREQPHDRLETIADACDQGFRRRHRGTVTARAPVTQFHRSARYGGIGGYGWARTTDPGIMSAVL